MLPVILGAASLSIWLGLVFGRGGFWRVSRRPPLPRGCGSVVAVIPARNEAETIGSAVASLLAQELSPVKIVVVDDESTDGTAKIAQAAASGSGRESDLTVVRGESLPSGWAGKVWAMAQGVARAEQFHPDFLLLTDADIRHGSRGLGDLVAIAQSRRCDLASFMVKLVCRTPAERLLIPAFVFFFFKLYPPAWTASDGFRTAGAAGGCMLIRTEMLRRIGGLAAIRGAVIDDCALARAVKQSGGRLWLGLTEDTESIRPYGSFAEIGRMVSRTAFYQLRHSPLLLLGTVAG
ncbi:MAG: glycosyltransferase, partial [Bryobacteraceae bacterium]